MARSSRAALPARPTTFQLPLQTQLYTRLRIAPRFDRRYDGGGVSGPARSVGFAKAAVPMPRAAAAQRGTQCNDRSARLEVGAMDVAPAVGTSDVASWRRTRGPLQASAAAPQQWMSAAVHRRRRRRLATLWPGPHATPERRGGPTTVGWGYISKPRDAKPAPRQERPPGNNRHGLHRQRGLSATIRRYPRPLLCLHQCVSVV